MKKLVCCNCSENHYNAQACVVWCFDDRFSGALKNFTDFCEFKNFDLVKVAGGAKSLSSPKEPEGRNFVLDQIKTSIKLHHTPNVILMTHSDCGAYGGLKNFSNNKEKEKKAHEKELQKAKKFLKNNLPSKIKIMAVFVDFDQIYKV